MDTKSKETIIAGIEDFARIHGGDLIEYYIGITRNLKDRIVDDTHMEGAVLAEHINKGKYRKGDPLYQAKAESNEVAVEIEIYFQVERKMQGLNPESRGKADSHYVYCFKTRVLDGKKDRGGKGVIVELIQSGKRKIARQWEESMKKLWR